MSYENGGQLLLYQTLLRIRSGLAREQVPETDGAPLSTSNASAEVAELASLFAETMPWAVDPETTEFMRTNLDATSDKRTGAPVSTASLKDRLNEADVADVMADGVLEWRSLSFVGKSEFLNADEAKDAQSRKTLDVNSGGQVYFLLLSPSVPGTPETVACLKFAPTRLATQSELCGCEMAAQMGVSVPGARLLRRANESEWGALRTAAEAASGSGAELATSMDAAQCALLMEFVRGIPLGRAGEAFSAEVLDSTCATLGRVLMLDMVLGNADRLPCGPLGWRGNRGNLLYSADKRIVAIDSGVARRPPAGRAAKEREAYQRLSELLITDADTASAVLQEAVDENHRSLVASTNCTRAFQRGFRDATETAAQLQGILKMLANSLEKSTCEVISEMGSFMMAADSSIAGLHSAAFRVWWIRARM
ncbi:hypothetical protein CYMTET_21255 [Cymbomonas tetramitiformis]|uniref:Actin-fragmin kinase catalytic domain-containing protein n=1 Tax=Cymbomonas tetramitiformis TaxID=36881 RepID=A0AAE0G369_9CHLO|nr:hypothetical protein CYMTET_21255 [Cymbomonas tetramitiformis]